MKEGLVMEKIALIFDSTVYLSQEVLEKNKVNVVSLNVIEGNETYKETEIDNDFVFERINKKIKLTTSQPSPSEFLDVYEKCLKEGYTDLIVLTLSKELSGTYQSALLAKNMLSTPKAVHLLDTNNAAYGNELLGLRLIELVDAKKPVQEILKQMEVYIKNSYLMFTVENLFFLQKGGRLSTAQALLGTVLRVKPVIKMIEGKLKLYHKERTHKKLYDFFVKEMKNDPNYGPDKKVYVRIITRDAEDSAKALEEAILSEFKHAEIEITPNLGPVFSIHVGPKGFGYTWIFE